MNDEFAGLTLVELLDLLEPVPEPPPVPLWPQTAGWLWLAAVLLVTAALLLWRLIAQRRANAYRRAALRALATAGGAPAPIAEVLRRAALAAYPRTEVAGLYGEAWLAFLDQTYGGGDFRGGPGRAIATAPYALPEGAADLTPLAADWLRRHRRSPAP
jgi:hypothetical protein